MKRSVAISCHGLSGSGVGISGSGCGCLFLLHVVQSSTMTLIWELSPGHQTDIFAFAFSAFGDALVTFVNLVEGMALQAGWND